MKDMQWTFLLYPTINRGSTRSTLWQPHYGTQRYQCATCDLCCCLVHSWYCGDISLVKAIGHGKTCTRFMFILAGYIWQRCAQLLHRSNILWCMNELQLFCGSSSEGKLALLIVLVP